MTTPDALTPPRPRLDISRDHHDALVAQAVQRQSAIIAERDALLAEKALRKVGYYEAVQVRQLALQGQEILRLRAAFGHLAIEIHDAATRFGVGDIAHGDLILTEAGAYAMQHALSGMEPLPAGVTDLSATRRDRRAAETARDGGERG